ncbi:inter-alpha-trypsin inhibitor heavy chain H5 isoform X2 [Protopterus annectens]|uniref:inter-alpha-trypsin inhibitor heavy chain H5 isoform X2 n=1 Tax=Protopterus annectens TaxID=7888 RepID=UPI001CF9B43B|nr:inter-alpha-trypsin inhibitor heavy chain H5 isoform X2 [Protopterus annectens]
MERTLLLLFLACLSWGQKVEEIQDYASDLDLFPFDFPDSTGARVARQTNVLQRLEIKPHITEFTVKSTIISRYAFTSVSCTILNRASESREAVFQLQLPSSAFISNFTIIVGEQVYPSRMIAKEKRHGGNKKKNQKTETAENAESDMDIFRVATKLPGKDKAIFLLTYEELLQRRLGFYEYVVSVRPQQLVGKLFVEVNLLEQSGIKHLEVAPLRKAGNGDKGSQSPPVATKIDQTRTTAKIVFKPSIVQQASIDRKGILGDFIIRYDVNREPSVGDVQAMNGFFVHYFAPKDLTPVPKNVVFVIDNSASMLGLKIKQTKDALFTILGDLRNEDHFNIVGFSSRIKVWQQDRLVLATPNNIKDAKKFIHLMSTSGGTNMNGGIQTGAKVLTDFIAKNVNSPKSISLIIFITDGRPTIGETNSSKIVANTKEVNKGQFCLYSIGIGKDVDFKLLERLSVENCGVLWKIPEEEDASLLLKGFYDQIGTPVLSDIEIGYSKRRAAYTTQNVYANYFNGSEIVIAGKLLNTSSSDLHVQVSARTSDKTVLLETDVPVSKNGDILHKEITSAEEGIQENGNYIERLWGYLTIKELLKTRMKSNSVKKREALTDQAKNLSVAYHFLTPVTTLKLEQDMNVQDPLTDISHNPSDESFRELPPVLQEQSRATGSSSKTRKKMKVSISKTSVDGDPHFVVDFPLSNITVCFNIDGEPDDILRLVSDNKHSGVTVNGKLIGAPAPVNGHKKQRTYFSALTILVTKPVRAYIEATPSRVILDSKDRLVLPCDKTATVESQGLLITLNANSNITVTIQDTISFVILFHQYKNPAPFQRNHLGFYIANSKGLSANTHGLLGQFLYTSVKIATSPTSTSSMLSQPDQEEQYLQAHNETASAMLKVKGHVIPVMKKQRKINNGKEQVDCWFVKNNAARLIDGEYKDYLVSHPFDSETPAWLTNELNETVMDSAK